MPLSWIAERLGSESNASRQSSRINDLPNFRKIKAVACKIKENAGIKDWSRLPTVLCGKRHFIFAQILYFTILVEPLACT
jgi:hypothetical protein